MKCIVCGKEFDDSWLIPDYLYNSHKKCAKCNSTNRTGEKKMKTKKKEIKLEHMCPICKEVVQTEGECQKCHFIEPKDPSLYKWQEEKLCEIFGISFLTHWYIKKILPKEDLEEYKQIRAILLQRHSAFLETEKWMCIHEGRSFVNEMLHKKLTPKKLSFWKKLRKLGREEKE